MMELLLVAATEAEIAPLRASLEEAPHVHVLVSGVGMMATGYHLGRALALQPYELVLNIGICGTFRPHMQPGSVVNVADETIADLGAEDGQGFLSVFDLELEDGDLPPFTRGKLVNPFRYPHDLVDALPQVSGLSVNSVSGSQMTIQRLRSFHNADVESMEGAAVFYACLMADVPFIEVRAISNYIEERNRNAWKVEEAMSNLSAWVTNFLNL